MFQQVELNHYGNEAFIRGLLVVRGVVTDGGGAWLVYATIPAYVQGKTEGDEAIRDRGLAALAVSSVRQPAKFDKSRGRWVADTTHPQFASVEDDARLYPPLPAGTKD